MFESKNLLMKIFLIIKNFVYYEKLNSKYFQI